MPTYAYSGLSSTSSSVKPQDERLDAREGPDDLLDDGRSAALQLADFEKVVDRLLGEHEKFEAQRVRAYTQLAYAVAVIFFLTIAFVFSTRTSTANTAHLTIASFVLALGSIILMVWTVFRSFRNQQRTHEELAELVREIAPAFMPKLSPIRRAEIKIRLSNIGIYDPLKYR
ncbi:MAG: hypothetical protein R6X02_32535 [Enhygromyxa sp.]